VPTVKIAYNDFFMRSFSSNPAPFLIIKHEVQRQHPNIQVEFVELPHSMQEVNDILVSKITEGNHDIDIYGLDVPWVAEFVSKQRVHPLNDLLPKIVPNFLAEGLESVTYNGVLAGVPIWTSISGLFYRTDLLAAYDIPVPTKYSELETTVSRIREDKPELIGFAWAGIRDEGLMQVWLEFYSGFGGDFSYNIDCVFRSEASIRAVMYMSHLINSDISPENTPDLSSVDVSQQFARGKVIFLRHNFDIATWLDNPEKSTVVGKWDLTTNLSESGKHATGTLGGFAMAANPHSKVLPAVMAVLRIIAGREVQKGFAQAWGPVQHYKGLYDDPDVRASMPNSDKMISLIRSSTARPVVPNYNQMSTALQNQIHKVLKGKINADEAMEKACREAGLT
jgi:multiple sugar transport system substrate-binding protein